MHVSIASSQHSRDGIGGLAEGSGHALCKGFNIDMKRVSRHGRLRRAMRRGVVGHAEEQQRQQRLLDRLAQRKCCVRVAARPARVHVAAARVSFPRLRRAALTIV